MIDSQNPSVKDRAIYRKVQQDTSFAKNTIGDVTHMLHRREVYHLLDYMKTKEYPDDIQDLHDKIKSTGFSLANVKALFSLMNKKDLLIHRYSMDNPDQSQELSVVLDRVLFVTDKGKNEVKGGQIFIKCSESEKALLEKSSKDFQDIIDMTTEERNTKLSEKFENSSPDVPLGFMSAPLFMYGTAAVVTGIFMLAMGLAFPAFMDPTIIASFSVSGAVVLGAGTRLQGHVDSTKHNHQQMGLLLEQIGAEIKLQQAEHNEQVNAQPDMNQNIESKQSAGINKDIEMVLVQQQRDMKEAQFESRPSVSSSNLRLHEARSNPDSKPDSIDMKEEQFESIPSVSSSNSKLNAARSNPDSKPDSIDGKDTKDAQETRFAQKVLNEQENGGPNSRLL